MQEEPEAVARVTAVTYDNTSWPRPATQLLRQSRSYTSLHLGSKVCPVLLVGPMHRSTTHQSTQPRQASNTTNLTTYQ